MASNPYFSVIIPTYKRGHIIDHALNGLTKQTFKNFEAVIVIRSSGDGTEERVDSYADRLCIRKFVLSNRWQHWDQLNYGISKAQGSVLAFLDDDAVPLPNWLELQSKIYVGPNIGGIAGNVLTATIVDGNAVPLEQDASEIIPRYKPALENIGAYLWLKPLSGLENNLIYITKAGAVEKNVHCSANAHIKSVLGMGANMSVSRKAIGSFLFPPLWSGSQWEQFLGWHLWRRGYDIVFCPEVKVYHLAHGQTFSRFIKDKHIISAREAGVALFFYNLYGLEKQLSMMHKVVSTMFKFAVFIRKMTEDKDTNQAKLKGLTYGNLLGMTWLISKGLKLTYTPSETLKTKMPQS
ncbi:MAG TPA: glycosyltransferase [Patescibacteria group bacterium]|nr:glycosyltransferase [Patescibacteria group bacterium]